LEIMEIGGWNLEVGSWSPDSYREEIGDCGIFYSNNLNNL